MLAKIFLSGNFEPYTHAIYEKTVLDFVGTSKIILIYDFSYVSRCKSLTIIIDRDNNNSTEPILKLPLIFRQSIPNLDRLLLIEYFYILDF